MASTLIKIVPAAAVAALVVWCTSTEESSAPTSKAEKERQLPPALLQPSASPAPARDPFGLKTPSKPSTEGSPRQAVAVIPGGKPAVSPATPPRKAVDVAK